MYRAWIQFGQNQDPLIERKQRVPFFQEGFLGYHVALLRKNILFGTKIILLAAQAEKGVKIKKISELDYITNNRVYQNLHV